MTTIKIEQEDFIEGIYHSDDILLCEMYDKGRWYYTERVVFKYDDKLYETFIEWPATEYQEIQHPKYFKCDEVEEYEKIIKEYRKIK